MILVVAVDSISFFLSPLVQLAYQGYRPVSVFPDFYYCIVAVGEKEMEFNIGRESLLEEVFYELTAAGNVLPAGYYNRGVFNRRLCCFTPPEGCCESYEKDIIVRMRFVPVDG